MKGEQIEPQDSTADEAQEAKEGMQQCSISTSSSKRAMSGGYLGNYGMELIRRHLEALQANDVQSIEGTTHLVDKWLYPNPG